MLYQRSFPVLLLLLLHLMKLILVTPPPSAGQQRQRLHTHVCLFVCLFNYLCLQYKVLCRVDLDACFPME